jgi:hypothetical protein
MALPLREVWEGLLIGCLPPGKKSQKTLEKFSDTVLSPTVPAWQTCCFTPEKSCHKNQHFALT